MTTNSPNPFVGDVQALIAVCKKEIEILENYLIAYPDHPALLSELQRQQVALVSLMAEPCVYHAQPVKTLQLPERNSEKPGELAERARTIMDDCNSLIRRINATEQPLSSDLAIPDGWKLVPIEPTEDMLIRGFESEPDELFSSASEWEEYEAMSGCQRASHRAQLCWAAMLSAAPEFSPPEKP